MESKSVKPTTPPVRDISQTRGTIVKIATCSLNQSALDFEGNKRNIIRSIQLAKENGCKIRLGPELEVTGIECEDHFHELDTFQHSWEVLEDILKSGVTDGILTCTSLPVIHKNISYDCGVMLFNSQILLIHPKGHLAEDGNYREGRWFVPWQVKQGADLEDFVLPKSTQVITG